MYLIVSVNLAVIFIFTMMHNNYIYVYNMLFYFILVYLQLV